jgi:hypothetical protein
MYVSRMLVILRRGGVAVLAAAALVLTVSPAFAQSEHVVPPQARPFGRTYGDWSAAWWQYVFSIPTPQNPLFDTTGAQCHVGQSGNVFFLVGSVLGTTDPIVRECTIPPGRMLFFPLVTLEDNVAEERQSATWSASR